MERNGEADMNELDFLNNEARIASAFAPEGAQLAVAASLCPDRHDVLVGKNAVARLQTRSEALTCIMGAGGAFADLSRS